jgi:hypothetical protein
MICPTAPAGPLAALLAAGSLHDPAASVPYNVYDPDRPPMGAQMDEQVRRVVGAAREAPNPLPQDDHGDVTNLSLMFEMSP